MNGYKPFGIESSAWQDGFEAGKRAQAAVKEYNMTPEEGILHIRKILDKAFEVYDDWGVVEQMRHEGELWNNAVHEIKDILNEVKTRFDQ